MDKHTQTLISPTGFRQRFTLGLIAAWLIPPITAWLGMAFLGFWTLEQAGLSLISFSGLYVIAFTLIAFVVMKNRIIGPVMALGESRHTPDPVHTKRLQAFPWIFWGLLSLYCFFGPATVLLSNAVFDGIEYTLGQYAYSAFGVIPSLLISAFPLFFYLTDLLGRFLGPRGVVVMVAPLWLKVTVLGLFTPVMIDTILLTYYFNRTGFLMPETIVLWFLLIFAAGVGTWIALRSFHQGMSALRQPLGGVVEAGLHAYPVPRSLDEFGVLSRGWAKLLEARDHAERKVTERNKHIRDIIDNTDAVICIKDKEGRYLMINRRFEQLFSLSNDDAKGKTDHDIFPKEIADAFRQNDLKVIQDEKPLEIQEIAPHQDGPHTYISQKFPLYDADRVLYGVCGISTDITERRRAEEDLRLRVLQQAAVAELGQLALGDEDLNSLFDAAVAQVARTIHVEYGKVLEYLPHDNTFLLRAGVGWREGLVGHATVGGEKDSQAGYTWLSSEPVIVADLRTETRFTGPPLLHEHGVVSGMSVIIHGKDRPFGVLGVHTAGRRTFTRDDVHFLQSVANVLGEAVGRQRAQEVREHLIKELEEKNAEMERFTYTVSHDLKSPLITIRGFLGLLEKDAAKGDTAHLKKDIRRISDSIEKMQRMLGELLRLSRVGRTSDPYQEVSMSELAGEAVDLVAGQIAERGVEIKVASNLPSAFVDRHRFLEVMQNLIDNAVKFMGDQQKPRVEIGVVKAKKNEGSPPVFYVRDNGLGIDPQYHERVFKLFERLDPHRSDGTGVGLALVKRIVEVHGGQIWVESKGRGKGSTFFFKLPVRKPEKKRPIEKSKKVHSSK